MEIAYCTRLIPHIPNLYEKYPNNKFIVSVDRFIMNQIVGIEEVTDKRVFRVNIPEVPSYPRFPAIIMNKASWSHTDKGIDIDVGFLNLPIIRQMIVPHEVKKSLRKWVKKNNTDKVILSYSTNPMSMSALVQLKKEDKNLKIVLVVGDLIGDKGINIKGRGLLNKLLNYYYQRGTEAVSLFDGYVLLTDYMAEELHVKNKPHIVIEGIYNKEYETRYDNSDQQNDEHKIVFHAGSLERQYGVFNLIEAFRQIKDEDYRLWLAGGSSESDKIEEYSRIDPRIQYFGFVSPQKVFELQGISTVIVNPRTAEGDFTKYSFPSKTMEGLASRKPFIGYKLPGIPDEYYKYIQCVENDTPESLGKKIKEICELSKVERDEIGNKAREFILSEKNCRAQGRKIVDFLESL